MAGDGGCGEDIVAVVAREASPFSQKVGLPFSELATGSAVGTAGCAAPPGGSPIFELGARKLGPMFGSATFLAQMEGGDGAAAAQRDADLPKELRAGQVPPVITDGSAETGNARDEAGEVLLRLAYYEIVPAWPNVPVRNSPSLEAKVVGSRFRHDVIEAYGWDDSGSWIHTRHRLSYTCEVPGWVNIRHPERGRILKLLENAQGDELPLMVASRLDCYSGVLRVLRSRVDPNGVDARKGWTPLFEAACGNAINSVAVLLNHGADVLWRTEDGTSCIDVAHGRQVRAFLGAFAGEQGVCLSSLNEAFTSLPDELANRSRQVLRESAAARASVLAPPPLPLTDYEGGDIVSVPRPRRRSGRFSLMVEGGDMMLALPAPPLSPPPSSPAPMSALPTVSEGEGEVEAARQVAEVVEAPGEAEAPEDAEPAESVMAEPAEAPEDAEPAESAMAEPPEVSDEPGVDVDVTSVASEAAESEAVDEIAQLPPEPEEKFYPLYEVVHKPLVAVRSAPDFQAQAIGAKRVGTIFRVLGTAPGWVEVEHFTQERVTRNNWVALSSPQHGELVRLAADDAVPSPLAGNYVGLPVWK